MARDRGTNSGGWPRAFGRALLVIAVSALGVLVVPDLLTRELSDVLTPSALDVVILLWTIVGIFVASRLLVRVQRDRT
ncbi:MAG: hypothetical protein MUP92_02000 [Actinobacteria bacterium]|nr:hypothetical protein [Actinomycetota bacterium]